MSEHFDADQNQTGYGPSVVIAAVDQINALAEHARAVPLSANIVLNKAELLDLVQQVRDALPDDLVAADAVVADAEAVLDRADSAADAAVREANLKARTLIEEARERADSIMSEARGEAERTVARADEEARHTGSRARHEAEDLLKTARSQAESMVAADSITQLASERAEQTVEAAETEAARLRAGADEYVATALIQVADLLSDLQRRTDAGLRHVGERTGQTADISIDIDEE